MYVYAVQSTLYRFDGSKKAKNSQARAGHQRSMGGRRSLVFAISFCGHACSAPRRRVIHHRSRLAQPSRDPPRTDRPPPPRAPAVAPCSPRWGSSLRGATTAGVRMWCPRLINKLAINDAGPHSVAVLRLFRGGASASRAVATIQSCLVNAAAAAAARTTLVGAAPRPPRHDGQRHCHARLFTSSFAASACRSADNSCVARIGHAWHALSDSVSLNLDAAGRVEAAAKEREKERAARDRERTKATAQARPSTSRAPLLLSTAPSPLPP